LLRSQIDRDGDLDLDVFVTGLLGRNLPYKIEWQPAAPAGEKPATAASPQASPSKAAFDRLDKQLESLASQLGELRKAMHDLHQTMQTETGKPAAEKK
jgi:hypothetical protein